MTTGRRRCVCAIVLVSCSLVGSDAFSGSGVVAIQTADPSCPGDPYSEVYHPCGNGTVNDNRTGLVWLADADCLVGKVDWYTAVEFVAGLRTGMCGLTDGSSPGEWRLPSASEWRQMIDDANGGSGELDCNPTISNDLYTGCWSQACFDFELCSFRDVQSGFYWSASPFIDWEPGDYAFGADLDRGEITADYKIGKARVWAVRGGQ